MRHTYQFSPASIYMNAIRATLTIAVHDVEQYMEQGKCMAFRWYNTAFAYCRRTLPFTPLWLPSNCDSLGQAIHSASIVLLPSVSESLCDYKSFNLVTSSGTTISCHSNSQPRYVLCKLPSVTVATFVSNGTTSPNTVHLPT